VYSVLSVVNPVICGFFLMAGKLLIATRNKGKLKELTALLAGVPFVLVSLDEAGIKDDVEETGATLEENAVLKATTYARLSGLPTLADDSGLEVDALGGEPGVRSSRYAGEGATDAQRIAFLLKKLQNIPEERWSARFRCVIAIAWPSEPLELFTGECPGRIISQPRGSNGFGYDPAFLLPQLGKTMAELSTEEKNQLSHRSVAARKAAAALRRRAIGRGNQT
jgi:XTP/dITP diphosphohydrolase